MNKLKQSLIVSTIATLSLFSQINEAIASVLNKKTHNTEELAKITDNTINALNINLDDNANITPPDSTEIKAFFMEWDILTNDEKRDFIKLRNNATQNGIRNFYEQQIIKFFDPIFDNEEKKMFIILLLDPNQDTQLWQTEFEKIKNSKIYRNIYIQSIESMKLEMNLAQSIEEWKKIKEEWKKIKEEWKKLDEDINQLKQESEQLKQEGEQLKQEGEQLDKMLQDLEKMEKTFEEYQKKEKTIKR